LTLTNCAVTDNISLQDGGGIFSIGGYLTMTNCTVNGNISTGYDGGGIYIANQNMILTNCTITGNSANNATRGDGGGLKVYDSSTANYKVVTNCTFTGNSSRNGGGIEIQHANNSITLMNTILANNTAILSGPDFYLTGGTVIDNGYNIVEYSSNYTFSAVGDITGEQANLNLSSTLADNNTLNGTQTLALSEGSIAINAGTDAGAPATDQRGFGRIGITDIGAYEYGVPISDFPADEGTDVGGGTTINPSQDLNYAADQTIPEIPNSAFTPNYSVVLSGNGIVDIIITTGSVYGAYYQSGSWHTQLNDGGAITFIGIDFDVRGDIPIVIGDDNPLPVTLSSFTAAFTGSSSILNWTTQSELNNAGWNIYRAASEDYALSNRINPNLINGAGTTSELTQYSYVDNSGFEYNATYYYWLESVDYANISNLHGPISVEIPEQDNPEAPEVPEFYGLAQNYPNPFNPSTEIMFKLQNSGTVKISVYNVKGEKVATLFDEFVPAESLRKVIWNGVTQNGKPSASGVYFYRLESSERTEIKKMLLIK
jgi:hypothetical protein